MITSMEPLAKLAISHQQLAIRIVGVKFLVYMGWATQPLRNLKREEVSYPDGLGNPTPTKLEARRGLLSGRVGQPNPYET